MKLAVTLGLWPSDMWIDAAVTADQLGGLCETEADIEAWEAAGVSRLIVSPWRRSREALEGLEAFARRLRLAS